MEQETGTRTGAASLRCSVRAVDFVWPLFAPMVDHGSHVHLSHLVQALTSAGLEIRIHASAAARFELEGQRGRWHGPAAARGQAPGAVVLRHRLRDDAALERIEHLWLRVCTVVARRLSGGTSPPPTILDSVPARRDEAMALLGRIGAARAELPRSRHRLEASSLGPALPAASIVRSARERGAALVVGYFPFRCCADVVREARRQRVRCWVMPLFHPLEPIHHNDLLFDACRQATGVLALSPFEQEFFAAAGCRSHLLGSAAGAPTDGDCRTDRPQPPDRGLDLHPLTARSTAEAEPAAAGPGVERAPGAANTTGTHVSAAPIATGPEVPSVTRSVTARTQVAVADVARGFEHVSPGGEAASGARRGPVSFVFVGRDEPGKNLDEALRIVESIREATGHDHRLDVVSQPTAERTSRLPGFVALVPAATPERLERLLGESEAVLFPAVLESLGLVVLEALRLGTPALVKASNLATASVLSAWGLEELIYDSVEDATRKVLDGLPRGPRLSSQPAATWSAVVARFVDIIG